MRITKVILRRLQMKMKFEFSTSFGTIKDKEFLLVEAQDEEGNSGWGETGAFQAPWYTEETLKTNLHMLEDFFIPALLGQQISHPHEVTEKLTPFLRNNMAKAAIETAIWDLYAKRKKIPLYQALGGTMTAIAVGVSLGIEKNIDDLLENIQRHVEKGYKRVKVKIKPGKDVEVIREIRRHFPSLPLMADANSAYTLEDIDTLKQLDTFELLMIEQPLAMGDIIDHAKIQKQLTTPICLDESITSFEDAKKALEIGSCKTINIKIGRVGGLATAKRIHDLCKQHDVPVWCGGMLDAGIGRAHNIALSTLDNFTLPGDAAGSARYWTKDIIQPEVIVENGVIHVPNRPGIGYEPDIDFIEQRTVSKKQFQ